MFALVVLLLVDEPLVAVEPGSLSMLEPLPVLAVGVVDVSRIVKYQTPTAPTMNRSKSAPRPPKAKSKRLDLRGGAVAASPPEAACVGIGAAMPVAGCGVATGAEEEEAAPVGVGGVRDGAVPCEVSEGCMSGDVVVGPVVVVDPVLVAGSIGFRVGAEASASDHAGTD